MKPGRAVHPSNGVGTAPNAATSPEGVVISFDQGANRGGQSSGQVVVSNLEVAGGNSLEISFSNGRRWFAIPPATIVKFDVLSYYCRVRGTSGATAEYSVLGIVY